MAGSAHAYPELTPRPSIRGCGTTGILPLRAAVKRKKREQPGSWIAKPALGAWENQPLPGPFSMYGVSRELDVTQISLAGF